MPTVMVLGTGGTITNTEAGRLPVDAFLEDLERRCPEGARPSDHAGIRTIELGRKGSEAFGPEDWVAIGREVALLLEDTEVDGIVVTHGTFTIEETAFFLHLAVPTTKPMVVTCSQRRHDAPGNDGDRNFLDAIRVACSSDADDKGGLVVVDEEIHSAREVRKTSRRPGGFTSGELGILGRVDADRVVFRRTPFGRHTAGSEFDVAKVGQLPRVDVVATYAGADDVAIRAFCVAGARGLVVNGFAYNGSPHPRQLPALREALESGVVVVLANRGGAGRVPAVHRNGFIGGDTLSAQKARVLLSLALTTTAEREELERIFLEY